MRDSEWRDQFDNVQLNLSKLGYETRLAPSADPGLLHIYVAKPPGEWMLLGGSLRGPEAVQWMWGFYTAIRLEKGILGVLKPSHP